jgi:phosphoglucosamine mutase
MRETGQSLSALAACMRKFPQTLVNVPVRDKPPLDTIPGLRARVAELEAEMNNGGRILLRYSGTESLVRVMVEGEDGERVERTAAELAGMLRTAIGR